MLLIRPDVCFSDRNWLEFISVIDAVFPPVEGSDISEGRTLERSENIEKTRAFLTEIAELDGSKNRSAPLARLELAKRASSLGISSGMINTTLEVVCPEFVVLQTRTLLSN